jgi:predicted nuclease of predicted toxin-antitoxin system
VRILADEGIDAAIVAALRSAGHDALYIAELSPSMSDDQVLERASSEERVLVTVDKDFGELVFRMARATFGVLLLRLPGLSSAAKADVVVQAISNHEDEMSGNFVVLSPALVRIRPPMTPGDRRQQ